jgi:hypothetical protein
MTFPFSIPVRAAELAGAAPRRTIGNLVDVGERATVVTTIIRGGEEVKPPALNTGRVEDFANRLVPLGRVFVPRVVSQSVPPGTRVAKGTPVDLMFVPVSDIDFSLFDKVHADLRPRTVESVLPLLNNATVAAALQKPAAADLSADEKTALSGALTQAGITINDADPERTLDVAFESLQSARAFQ